MDPFQGHLAVPLPENLRTAQRQADHGRCHGRKRLQRRPGQRGQRPQGQGHAGREQRRPVRVPRRVQERRRRAAAGDHRQGRRRLSLRHHRPGRRALPQQCAEGRPRAVFRRPAPGPALPASVRRGAQGRLRGPSDGNGAHGLRHHERRRRPAVQDPRRRHREADRPADRSPRARLQPGQGKEPGSAGERPARHRQGRRDRRSEVRRPVQAPHQRLQLQLRPDAQLRRQHRAVPAVRLHPRGRCVPQAGQGLQRSRRPDRARSRP